MKQKIFAVIATVFISLGSFYSAFAQQTYPIPATNDTAGFESIFDGKSLAGWEGDTNYWRVENGCLVGEATPEMLFKKNSFIIWHGGGTGDFEL